MPWLARKPLRTASANAPGRWSTVVALRPKRRMVNPCPERSRPTARSALAQRTTGWASSPICAAYDSSGGLWVKPGAPPSWFPLGSLQARSARRVTGYGACSFGMPEPQGASIQQGVVHRLHRTERLLGQEHERAAEAKAHPAAKLP